jgi:gamma-glutamyl:cysteine ligase YbdK (ATP-grasp superfamily)
MVPHRFGESPPFSVGIEEELFVLDAAALEPAPVPGGVLDGERLKPELFTTMLELTTSVCDDAAAAAAEVAACGGTASSSRP